MKISLDEVYKEIRTLKELSKVNKEETITRNMKFDKKVNESLKEYIINSQDDSYEVLHDCDDISEEEYNLDIDYIRKVIEKNESDFLKNNPYSAKNKNKNKVTKSETFCLETNVKEKNWDGL